VILVAPGEEAQAFDLAIGLDRDYPMLTAVGMVSPVVAVPSAKGPPHVGDTGWLYHLDVPNLLLTSLRPAPGGADGVVARVVECGSHAGHAEFRCVRDPASVQRVNLRGEVIDGISYHGDTVFLDTAEGELVQLRIDFTAETPPEPPPGESSAGGYDYDRPPDTAD
jgi:alpha-mannosidase